MIYLFVIHNFTMPKKPRLTCRCRKKRCSVCLCCGHCDCQCSIPSTTIITHTATIAASSISTSSSSSAIVTTPLSRQQSSIINEKRNDHTSQSLSQCSIQSKRKRPSSYSNKHSSSVTPTPTKKKQMVAYTTPDIAAKIIENKENYKRKDIYICNTKWENSYRYYYAFTRCVLMSLYVHFIFACWLTALRALQVFYFHHFSYMGF